jgi:excisionase family DNA binding protein
MNHIDSLYATVSEAAALLGLHPDSVRRLVRARRIPCKRLLIGQKREVIRIPIEWIRSTTSSSGGSAA